MIVAMDGKRKCGDQDDHKEKRRKREDNVGLWQLTKSQKWIADSVISLDPLLNPLLLDVAPKYIAPKYITTTRHFPFLTQAGNAITGDFVIDNIKPFLNSWVLQWGETPLAFMFETRSEWPYHRIIFLFVDQRKVTKKNTACLRLRFIPFSWLAKKKEIQWWLTETESCLDEDEKDIVIRPTELMSFMKLFHIECLYLLKPRGSCEDTQDTQVTIKTMLRMNNRTMYKQILLKNEKLSAYINIPYKSMNESNFSLYAQLFLDETFAKYNLVKKIKSKIKSNEIVLNKIKSNELDVEDIVKELSM